MSDCEVPRIFQDAPVPVNTELPWRPVKDLVQELHNRTLFVAETMVPRWDEPTLAVWTTGLSEIGDSTPYLSCLTMQEGYPDYWRWLGVWSSETDKTSRLPFTRWMPMTDALTHLAAPKIQKVVEYLPDHGGGAFRDVDPNIFPEGVRLFCDVADTHWTKVRTIWQIHKLDNEGHLSFHGICEKPPMYAINRIEGPK